MSMIRVTFTLEPEDVDLLDRMSSLMGTNRSSELRDVLRSLRPTLQATIRTLEAAQKSMEYFHASAAQTALGDVIALSEEVEKLQNAYLGAVARLEGAQAANPRASDTGVRIEPPYLEMPPIFGPDGSDS